MTQRCPAPNPTCGGLFLDRVGGCSERGGRGTRETARGRDKPERDLLLPNLFSRPKPSSQPDTARCDHRRRLAPSSPPTIIIPSLGPCLLASAHVSLLLACFLLLFFPSWPLCCLKSPFYHPSGISISVATPTSERSVITTVAGPPKIHLPGSLPDSGLRLLMGDEISLLT